MNTIAFNRVGGATIALLVLLVGCKKSTDVVAVTSQDCQLQSEQTDRNGGQQITTTTHSYNGNGQLVKTVAASSGSSITYTYTYDSAGNVITANTQGATSPNNSINSTGSYEYTGGRLTKLVSKSLSSSLTSDTYNYTYDGSGQLSTYSYSSSDLNYGVESYTFASGMLTSGTITRGGQSLSLTITNGRVASVTYSGGGTTRYTYDANGYLTRSDFFDKDGTLQSYTTNEYSTTVFKRAMSPYRVVPKINLYGNTELPLSRGAVYNADGSLKAETIYQYQVNSKGYISSSGYTQNIPGVGGQGTSLTTYTYSNCQWVDLFLAVDYELVDFRNSFTLESGINLLRIGVGSVESEGLKT